MPNSVLVPLTTIHLQSLSPAPALYRAPRPSLTRYSTVPAPNRKQTPSSNLAYDKPASLVLLLFAMHSRFDHVPACLPIDALYDLIVVAQKYGATAASRPWTGKWTLAVAVELEGEDDKLPKAMSIYWALGRRAGFFNTVARFAECAPDLETTDLADL